MQNKTTNHGLTANKQSNKKVARAIASSNRRYNEFVQGLSEAFLETNFSYNV